jgi:hypothetical protein
VTVAFTWSVVPPTVTLAAVAAQRGALGQATSVQLAATDNNAAAITYRAIGLPGGLTLDRRTGLISGTPTVAGTANVTITASASGATTAVTNFPWTIVGPPGVTRARLSGVRGGTPTLQLSFVAGIDAAALARISFSLPSGLSFATGRALSRGLSVGGQQFTASVSGGRLTIALRTALESLTLKLGPPALRSAPWLRRALRANPSRRLSFRVELTNAAGTPTIVPVSVAG